MKDKYFKDLTEEEIDSLIARYVHLDHDIEDRWYYVCDFCLKPFKFKDSVKYHLKTKHFGEIAEKHNQMLNK